MLTEQQRLANDGPSNGRFCWDRVSVWGPQQTFIRSSQHTPVACLPVRARRIPELDGLRGIAIILVLLVHFGALTLTAAGKYQEWLASALHLGWSGVDLFFVLSGYLITDILLRSRKTDDYYRVFYRRRIVRIAPLYYVFLVGFGLISMANGRASSEQIWYWAYLSNMRNAFGIHIPEVNHFWSLAIEEQFYLVWPFVVRKLSVRSLSILCVVIAVGSFSARCWFAWHNPGGSEFVYELTPFRLEPLAYGALIAIAFFAGFAGRVTMKYVAGIGALLLAFGIRRTGNTWYTAPMMEVFGYSGVALVYAAVVFWCVRYSASRRISVFRFPAFANVGKYSYCIYVVHMPIAVWLVPFVRGQIGTTPAAALFAVVIGSGIAYCIARLTFPAEMWFRRFTVTATVAGNFTWKHFDGQLVSTQNRNVLISAK